MRCWTSLTVVTVLVLAATTRAQSQSTQHSAVSDRDKLVGAWRLVSLQAPDSAGQLHTVAGLTGELIYTHDGHMSVQIMYPQASLSNDYVLNGYEASFGSYDVNELARTVTHHVHGSITRQLVGKNLVRVYEISGRRLTVRSVRTDEHWSVTWEHE